MAIAAARTSTSMDRDELERVLVAALEESPIGVSIIDRDGHGRLYCNQTLCTMLGAASPAMLERTDIADSFADGDEHRQLMDDARSQGVIKGREYRRTRLNGEPWWCMVDVSPIVYDGMHCFVVWHYDITERKQAEEAMQEAKEVAEQSLAKLRRALDSLAEAEKMAALGSLVAGLTHEVATPIGSALGAASYLGSRCDVTRDTLSKGALKKSEAMDFMGLVDESCEIILANLERANDLLGSFKQVSADQSHDHRRRFRLRDYLDKIVSSLRPQLKRQAPEIIITCDDSLELDSFPGAFAQMITNFFMNALLHGFDGGTGGTIRLTLREADKDHVEIIFADNGKGIAADDLPRLFDAYFTTRRGTGGTGLGLHIVRTVVTQVLGGQIEVHSKPGQGATFVVRIPKVAPK